MSEAISSILSTASDTAKLRLQAGTGEEQVDNEVIHQFEALFLQQMLKSMRTASLSEGMFQSEQSEFYRDMYDQQIAADMASQELLGISKLINQQLGGASSADTSSDKNIQAIPFKTDVHEGIKLPEKLLEAQLGSSGAQRFDKYIEKLSDGLSEVSTKINISETQSVRPLAFKPESPNEFVELVYEYAREPAKKLGVDADVLVAIAALETGWGSHLPQDGSGSSNNYFGIKADSRWQGESVGSQTLEFEGDTFNELKQSFRAYDSLKESFDDFAEFILGNERYSQALEFSHDTTRFLQEMQNAGYATDPQYSNKILNVLKNNVFSNN